MSTPSLDYTCAGCGELATKKMWREHVEGAKVLGGIEFDKLFEASKRLAETGDASMQLNLGLSYHKGKAGVAIDLPKAIKWYTLAAEAGIVKAQFNLGNCFFIGDGVTVDKREAVKWFKRAAEAGDAFSQYNLGNSYFNGDGVTVDKREAIKWFTLAAEAGISHAQFNLGNCFLKGDGIAVDKNEAIKWFTRAAEAGHAKSQTILDSLKKEWH
jgi:TPR repeat protein